MDDCNASALTPLRKSSNRVLSPRFDSDFLEASRWAQGYAPQGDQDVYEIIAEQAQVQYDLLVAIAEGLDKKADELVKFTTAIAGTATALVASGKLTVQEPIPAAIALFAAIVSTYFAIRARTPIDTPTPINPRDLLKVADLAVHPKPHEIRAVLSASYHVAILGMRTLTTWKAGLMARSTVLFFVGLIFMFTAFF